MSRIYRAFVNGKEITGHYVNGQEISKVWGGGTLLWEKSNGTVEEEQWWGEYDLYTRFKDPAPYKRAEVGFTVQGKDAPYVYDMAFGFCVRVVNGIYMVSAAAVDNYVLTGVYRNNISMVPACCYSMTTNIGDQILEYPFTSSGGPDRDDVLEEYRLYTKTESEPIYSWGGAFEAKPFWFKDSDKEVSTLSVTPPQIVKNEDDGDKYYYPARVFSNVSEMKRWLLAMRANPDKWWTDK